MLSYVVIKSADLETGSTLYLIGNNYYKFKPNISRSYNYSLNYWSTLQININFTRNTRHLLFLIIYEFILLDIYKDFELIVKKNSVILQRTVFKVVLFSNYYASFFILREFVVHIIILIDLWFKI